MRWLSIIEHEGVNCHEHHVRERLLHVLVQVHVEQVVCGHLVRLMECLDDCHCGVDCHYCLEFVVKVWQSSVEHEGREVSTQSVIIELLGASIVESVREDVVFKLGNVNRL